MVEVKKYQLPPTDLIPNSPQPLLHYPGLFTSKEDLTADKVHELYKSNGWQTQWIFRYGQTQDSHYHSQAHECMTVLSGAATIRFGVADTSKDLEESTHGNAQEAGGVTLQAKAGDVFVLPAGTAHKTYDTSPKAAFALLTPGNGHFIDANDTSEALRNIQLDGFTMIGSYPNGGVWDSMKGGEDVGAFEKVWNVPKPNKDPVLGNAEEGLLGTWQ